MPSATTVPSPKSHVNSSGCMPLPVPETRTISPTTGLKGSIRSMRAVARVGLLTNTHLTKPSKAGLTIVTSSAARRDRDEGAAYRSLQAPTHRYIAAVVRRRNPYKGECVEWVPAGIAWVLLRPRNEAQDHHGYPGHDCDRRHVLHDVGRRRAAAQQNARKHRPDDRTDAAHRNARARAGAAHLQRVIRAGDSIERVVRAK